MEQFWFIFSCDGQQIRSSTCYVLIHVYINMLQYGVKWWLCGEVKYDRKESSETMKPICLISIKITTNTTEYNNNFQFVSSVFCFSDFFISLAFYTIEELTILLNESTIIFSVFTRTLLCEIRDQNMNQQIRGRKLNVVKATQN